MALMDGVWCFTFTLNISFGERTKNMCCKMQPVTGLGTIKLMMDMNSVFPFPNCTLYRAIFSLVSANYFLLVMHVVCTVQIHHI